MTFRFPIAAVAAAVLGLFNHATALATTLEARLVVNDQALAWYDATANLTYLADANYLPADATGYSHGWTTDYGTALSWVTALDVAGVTGWRLMGGVDGATLSCDGMKYCADSELSQLFYNVLGGQAGSSITDVHNSNYDLFHNIYATGYWSGPANSLTPPYGTASYLDLSNGTQTLVIGSGYRMGIWAVHSGDVAALSAPDTSVPEPGNAALFAGSLTVLAGLRRRLKG